MKCHLLNTFYMFNFIVLRPTCNELDLNFMEFCLLGVVLFTTSQDLFYYEQGRGLVSAHIRLFIFLDIPFLEF